MAEKSWSRQAADPERPCTKCGLTPFDGAKFRFRSAAYRTAEGRRRLCQTRHSWCVDCTIALNREYRQAVREGRRIPVGRLA